MKTIIKKAIQKELEELINILSNDEIIKKQAQNNDFELFKKSNQLRKLINEFAVAKFEKYAINGLSTCETQSGKLICKEIGNQFLNIFYKN